MIEFQNIDDFEPSKAELNTLIKQRYLYAEIVDLRSERSTDSVQRLEFQLTTTSLPNFPDIEIEQLYESRDRLIKERNKLLNSWLLFLRPSKKKHLEIIGKQLDEIEYQIIALQEGEREDEASRIKKFINDSDKLIQKYNSETNYLG
jgi:hypothetical protein